jgi:hypothetical protein
MDVAIFDRKYEKCIHQYKILDANVSFERLVKRRFALATSSSVLIGLEAHVSHEMQRGTNPCSKNKTHYNSSNNTPTSAPYTHQTNIRQAGVGFDRLCKRTCTLVRYLVFGLEVHVSHDKRRSTTPHLPQTHQTELLKADELV